MVICQTQWAMSEQIFNVSEHHDKMWLTQDVVARGELSMSGLH